MENEEVKVKVINQNNQLKINPKYYPVIWIVMIFCSFVRNFYQSYMIFMQTSNVALGLYNGLIDFVIGGGSSAVLILVLTTLLYHMGARRGMRAIPQKDFIYTTMIFVSIAWFVTGMINMFSFLEPAMQYCNIFTTDIAVMTVSLALMFFLVFVPNYLNPKQAERHFKFYGKIYVIYNAVVYIFGAMGVLSCIAIADDPALLSQLDNVYYSNYGTDIPIKDLFEMFAFAKEGMMISSYISIGLAVAMIVAYFVLANVLTNKAKDFKEEIKPEMMEGIFFTDGKNFYTVEDLKNGKMGVNPDKNPFDDDDDNGDGPVFEELDF